MHIYDTKSVADVKSLRRSAPHVGAIDTLQSVEK